MTADAFIAETTASQRLAANPALSAFVSANAGSGKTRVLTNRVARLLLGGADPSTILCITFTKAAATEMSDRLFRLLGEWALAADEVLQKELVGLDGDSRIRSREELAQARRLFARALETPGGLKIQTIHSFCESVLKRFPLEAGVAPGFSVIEELESARLKQEAVDQTAACADGVVADAFAHLLFRMRGEQLRELLADALGNRRKFARLSSIGCVAFASEISTALGADAGRSSAELKDSLLQEFDRNRMKDILAVCDAVDGAPKKQLSPWIRRFLSSKDGDEGLAALAGLFLNSKNEPRQSFGTKATDNIDASLEPFLIEMQALFLSRVNIIRGVEAFEDTRACLTVIERCHAKYAQLKSARAALDFDDLIERTRALFHQRCGAQWVLYKLDKGLSHILLDEAQDTGPDAWDVIEAPLAEFFAGEGAYGINRTFFAVGDQKQSIYSFQGADAALFSEKEGGLGKKIEAASPYKSVSLKASFRTVEPVLRFVDALFRRNEVIENVSQAKPLTHYCTREGAAGFVELWPLVERQPPNKIDPWDAPLDASTVESAPRLLAKEVSGLISGWLTTGEILESQGRAIEPGDIMILVQSRGGRSKNALFSEIIRELGKAGVPVAGADKIRLMEDQGVLDLVSYARAVLFLGDDLSLAETLRSPFFEIDEDSLYDLAAERTERTLWEMLECRRRERDCWAAAYDEISRARLVALHDGATAFFTHIMETGTPSGWRRMAERLGAPSREPIEEFLRQAHEYELRHPRSLRLFLAAIVKAGAEISRESSEAGQTVRVMTAHKAKGLEANIVFLIDAHRPARADAAGPQFMMVTGPNGAELPVLVTSETRSNSILRAAADRAKALAYDEYRRLLYVAATRARDRLYICGCERGNYTPHKQPVERKSWHALSEDAFDDLGDSVADAGERMCGRARRLAVAQSVPVKTPAAETTAPLDSAPDDCLFRPATRETRVRRLTPSRLTPPSGADPAYSPLRSEDAFLRGRILHRLLELLPGVAPASREAAAERLLSRHLGEFDRTALDAMRREAFAVLDHPQFAPIFAPGGISEAAIGGAPRGGRHGLLLSGQIDRLVFCGDRILIVDYKTNRPPPRTVEDAPLAYIAQMAAYRALLQEIYPGYQIEAALLWTFEARLMPIPAAALDRAHELTLA